MGGRAAAVRGVLDLRGQHRPDRQRDHEPPVPRLIAADRPFAALFVGYVCSVPYNVVAVVGVWRSAARHPGERAHAELARIVTLVGMILLSFT